ncbi:MAG: hypothetical protein DCC68_02330 [Planctomycetota bacterium]|nr:MAG: hypothetical protein DCC68_02330 [Planctomycetota bacterium]
MWRNGFLGRGGGLILKAMLFADRISLPNLAALSRRLAIGSAAGIDVRTLWRRESERGPAALRREAGRVFEAVSAGEAVGDAIAPRAYFPKLFRQLVAVGDETGNLAEVYKRLADHYDDRVKLRRSFLAGLTWPAIQLAMAVLIVGVLIWAMGAIASMYPGRKPLDPLGIGLAGTSGVIVYVSVVAAIAAIAALAIRSAVRGAAWTRPLQRLAFNLPLVGRPLRTIALARLSWTLHLTMNSAMEVRQALRLALESSGSAQFASLADTVCNAVATGSEIHEALRSTRAFPADFLDAVEVSEHSGSLVESLDRLSRQYEEQAQAASGVLATIAGFAVWAMVAALIIVVIFRLFFSYLGMYRSLM